MENNQRRFLYEWKICSFGTVLKEARKNARIQPKGFCGDVGSIEKYRYKLEADKYKPDMSCSLKSVLSWGFTQ
jgi:hypothetical protein